MPPLLSSSRCQNCKHDIVGPIASIDDVKWNLGSQLLACDSFSKEDIETIVSAAKQQIEYLDLQFQLASKMEEGFLCSYFDPLLRQDIKNVIEKMDQVSSGPRRAVDRSYEDVLLLQQSQHDAMGHVSKDAGVPSGREDEADSVTPDIFPPPGMFCLD